MGDGRRRGLRVPPQHGAWAFLAIPLVVGMIEAGVTLAGVLLAVAWVCAYPTTYFLAQGIAARVRRRSWTARARESVSHALPWAGVTAVAGIALAVMRPSVLLAAAGLAMVWLASLWLTLRGRERGFANDLLLVAMAAAAVPVMWWVSRPEQPVSRDVWLTALVLLVFFTGSVIHVKSLIREARDPRWRRGSIAFHAAALATAMISPWLLVAYAPALVRTVVMRPPLRPARIGAVEIAMSVLLVAAVVLAFPPW